MDPNFTLQNFNFTLNDNSQFCDTNDGGNGDDDDDNRSASSSSFNNDGCDILQRFECTQDLMKLNGIFEETDSIMFSNNDDNAMSASANDTSATGTIDRVGQQQKQMHSCDICSKQFPNELRMKKHQKSHAYDKPYQCDKCSESFNVLENLTLHMAIHSVDQFRCPQCGKIFNRLASLDGHIKNHFKSEYFTCSMCGIVFDVEQKLIEHQQRVHPKVNKVTERFQADDSQTDRTKTCSICGKSFNKTFTLLRHERIHTNEKPYKCDICDRTFTQKNSLVIHQLKHTGERPYECSQCPIRFTQSGNLQLHIQRCHPPMPINDSANVDSEVSVAPPTVFTCSHCSCTFRKSAPLIVHMKKYHSDAADKDKNDSFIDDVMKQLVEIDRSNLLPIIMNDKSNELDDLMMNPFEMQSIDARTMMNDQLLTVQSSNSINTSAPRHICLICNKSFSRPSDLIRHERIHTKEKPYKCDVCQRRFNVKGTLKAHMQIHERDPIRVPCPICQQTFRSQKSMELHSRLKHTGAAASAVAPDKDATIEMVSNVTSEVAAPTDERELNSVIQNPTEESTLLLNENIVSISDDIAIPQINVCASNFIIYDTGQELEPGEYLLILSDPANPFTDASEPNDSSIDAQNQETQEHNNNEIMTNESIPLPATSFMDDQSSSQPPAIEKPPRPHKCHDCGKSFLKPIDLRRHQRIHTGERPFECDICQRRFTLQCTLNTHRNIHSQEKPQLTCQICNNRFSCNSSLQVHMRIHTGIRPYKCPYCTLTFRTNGHRSSHVQVHLKEAQLRNIPPEQVETKRKKNKIKNLIGWFTHNSM